MIRIKHDKKSNYIILYSDRRMYLRNADGGKCGSVHIPIDRMHSFYLIGYSESEDSVYDYVYTDRIREYLDEEYAEYDSLPDYTYLDGTPVGKEVS